jgi:DNA-binding response OmpR family regulator
MVKPFSLEVLVAQVRKLLGKLPGQIVNPDSA